VIDPSELGTLFAGLRASITVADEDGFIVFLNDLAVARYADQGGKTLVGADLHDCHNPASQTKIREMYARYRARDLGATRYQEKKGDGFAETIVVIPIIVEGRFCGVAELIWSERQGLADLDSQH
jgi:hypothetical protein